MGVSEQLLVVREKGSWHREHIRGHQCFVFAKVNVLDEDSLSMDIEFSIRETTCRRDSGEDPATCDFQRGYYTVSVVAKATSPPRNPWEEASRLLP